MDLVGLRASEAGIRLERDPPVEAVLRRRVLLVESDARAARLLARMLREDGYEVEIVVDGGAAVGRLSRGARPDIVLADHRLAHTDGVAVLRYARVRAPEARLVLVTNRRDLVERELTAEDAGLVVLEKPFGYADLVSRLR